MAAATTPVPSATPTLVGSWIARFSETVNGQVLTTKTVLTFLNNGTYLLANREANTAGTTTKIGLEMASYSWDAATGVLSSTTIFGNPGAGVGIPKDATATAQLQANGTLKLVVGTDRQNISFEPVLGGGNSIVGSWYSDSRDGGSDDVVITFLSDLTLVVADKGTTARDPNGQSGVEYGTYTWDAATGAASYTIRYNTDGQWGLSNGGPRKLVISGNTLLTLDVDGTAGTAGPSFIRASNLQTATAGTTGSAASETLTGTAGNDRLSGAGGNDALDGGGGIDTAVYSGNYASYALARASGSFIISDSRGTDGIDTLANIERLAFADRKIALDLSGNAGTTAKILGAVFGRAAVANKDYVGIGLAALDSGTSYASLMQLAINARLGPGASNTAIVNLLYTNVIGSAPGAAELALYKGLLDSGAHTPGTLGMLAADTPINQANVNLVGLAATGIEYT